MIRKNLYGISPDYEIAIDGVPVDYMALNGIEMMLESNMHDMLVLTMAGLPPKASSDYRDRPVRCMLSLGPSITQVFVGYVSDVRLSASTNRGLLNNSPFQDVRLVCLGASYEMRSGNSRVWSNYRLQDVVEEYSRKYQFSADVPDDGLIYPNMFQDNESDWQFLVKYASLLGYETTLHGTHLHIFDPYKAYTRSNSYHVLSTVKDIKKEVAPKPGQIASYTSSYAQRHADGYYMDSIVAVHQITGEVYDVSTRSIKGITVPARFNNRIQDSVYTYEQAVRTIDVESKSTYDFDATVVVSGIPGCVPGGLVLIDKYGGTDSDAIWYVKSVHHHLTSGAFTSELKLVRNINSELQPCSVAKFKQPPDPRLIDRWLTTDRTVNAYS